MKKLGALYRETLEAGIKKQLEEAGSVFIVKYSKLSSPDITALRQSLKDTNATLFVAKNSVARRALKDSNLEDLISFVDGPCGIVFAKGEVVDASRTLYNFYREHEHLKLECGIVENRVLNTKDIEVLAKLPGKDVLRAQVVMTIKSPITGLVYTLKQTLSKIVYCFRTDKEEENKLKLKREEEMASEKMDGLIKSIEEMTVMDLSDLVKALEEKFGVQANMPMMAMPAAAGAAGGASAPEEEKSAFTVVLTSAGANKIAVIKEVRTMTSLGLKEAKDLVDAAPKPVKESVPKEEAEEMKKKLEAAGASVELK